MLEARDRVGGRVHSYTGGGFSGPIDLGASLITGTATDVAKGLRPDPSAVVARYALRMLRCAPQVCSSMLLLIHTCMHLIDKLYRLSCTEVRTALREFVVLAS